MKYIINIDINIAQSEVNELNEKTAHLWTDGITQRLVNLQPNQFNTQYMYPFLDNYKEYYTPEMLSKVVDVLPNDWSDNEEI
jgi:hypothetical protein